MSFIESDGLSEHIHKVGHCKQCPTLRHPMTVSKVKGWTLFVVLLAWSFAQGANASEIRIEEASTRVINEVLVIDARLHFDIGLEAREAIINGVPITFVIDVALELKRRYLWNLNVTTLTQAFRLEHHALADQFRLVNLATGASQVYLSLDDAIADLQRLRALPVIEKSRLDPNQQYVIAVRARLDIESLPALLRPRAYLSSDWRMSSGWHQWEIKS